MTATPCFTMTRTFNAPRARVWSAWTTPEALAQWFGPKGSSSEILCYDLRPGGEWRGRMEAPDGNAMYSKFIFREVDPMSRLVWVHGFADAAGSRIRAPFAQQFPPRDADYGAVRRRGRQNQGRFQLDAARRVAEEEAFFANMMASMSGGWSGSFEQLDEFLAASPAA